MSVFQSVNADVMPGRLHEIAGGTFERVECDHCGHVYQPEHRMLLAHATAGQWIVMHPLEDRAHFATLERGVELIMEREFAAAPRVVAGVARRPRLVFGQRMLGEAVRAAGWAVDSALLECAKLLVMHRDLDRFLALGPFELCCDELADDGSTRHTVWSLSEHRALDEVRIAGDVLEGVQAARGEMRQRYPDLFERPYISACRYFFGATT